MTTKKLSKRRVALWIVPNTKIRNVFGYKMSLDIKLSQDQLPKVIQLCGFLGKALGNEVI